MTNLYWLIFLVYSKLYCCLYCVFSESDNLFNNLFLCAFFLDCFFVVCCVLYVGFVGRDLVW